MLLSDDAIIHTKPELEIYADDVKCTHGATVGQLDDKAMFYLRARGLDTDGARRLLMRAYVGEIIEKISDDIIEKIDISDDDEESDIKLFKNISEKIKEEISLATSEHAGAKKVAEATNDTHEILEEEAHAVV